MKPTAFLDLDGCLVDSRGPITSCVEDVLRERGLGALTPTESDAFIGPPLVESFRALLAGRDATGVDANDFVRAFRKRYEIVSLSTTIVAGIDSALEALGKRASLVIVTSKPQYLAEPILERLAIASKFDAVFGPQPDAFDESKVATLARARAGRPSHASDAMIGDRRHDIEAARTCGVRAIGVAWGVGSLAELHEAGAEAILQRPEQLADVFG